MSFGSAIQANLGLGHPLTAADKVLGYTAAVRLTTGRPKVSSYRLPVIFITRPSYEENSMPGDGKDEPAAKGYKEVGSGG